MCVCECEYTRVYTSAYVYTSHTTTYMHSTLTERSAGSCPPERGEKSFQIIAILPLWKLKKKGGGKENGIFGFEIHDKIKDDNAHRFFQAYIINNTGKHMTDQ